MLDQLQKKIQYKFKNIALLKQSLVHRSVSREHNERLEFLGDGCLNFVIAYVLFNRFSHAKEGDLSNVRAHLVKEHTLYEIATDLNLTDYLVISHGERKNDGVHRAALLADAVEAIIAAVFLDSGFEDAQRVILNLYSSQLQKIDTNSFKVVTEAVKDPKSRLQEYLQSQNQPIPEYKIVTIKGQDHAQIFQVACHTRSFTTTAEGTSKKRAEQKAAQMMLEKIL